jgi:A/G-specific adenine glycosylase
LQDIKKKAIQRNLLQWFERNARDLPWRRTQDPYAIWVSEIMLQQTQVDTVIPYYRKFIRTFPTVERLARADLSKVLKVWEGLGYYSRARNLQKAARIIASQFHGRIPGTLDDLKALPGIGRYTAGAILSIAFNKEAPILDGNVKRVLSRLFAISENPGKGEANGNLWLLSESLIPRGQAGSFNQALMDLGATICTPRVPRCSICPLRDLCRGMATGNPELYPAKIVKNPVPHRNAIAAVIYWQSKVLLRQRPPSGLLGGLWEFPNWEIGGNGGTDKKWIKNQVKKELGTTADVGESIGTFHHAFTHFKLTLQVFQCQARNKVTKGRWVSLSESNGLAMPRLHRRIAQTIGEKLQKMR